MTAIIYLMFGTRLLHVERPYCQLCLNISQLLHQFPGEISKFFGTGIMAAILFVLQLMFSNRDYLIFHTLHHVNSHEFDKELLFIMVPIAEAVTELGIPAVD